jgi:hypothetical protein
MIQTKRPNGPLLAHATSGGGPGAEPAGRGVGVAPPRDMASELGERSPRAGGVHERAGDGNRTRMTSLEGWGSAIELHPRARR